MSDEWGIKCYPKTSGVKPFTVPIVGKLTSGNKRPCPTKVVKQYTEGGKKSGEDPVPALCGAGDSSFLGRLYRRYFDFLRFR